MKVCPNCHIDYDDMQNFCVQCGKKLEKGATTLDSLDNRLKRMEESIGKMGPKPAGQGHITPEMQKGVEDMRSVLLEKISHNADALERLSERVKEMDGVSEEGKKRAKELVAGIIREESGKIGTGIVSDLRKENQNIKKGLTDVVDDINRLRQELEIIKKGLDQIESNVAKSIYKELTKSLVK